MIGQLRHFDTVRLYHLYNLNPTFYSVVDDGFVVGQDIHAMVRISRTNLRTYVYTPTPSLYPYIKNKVRKTRTMEIVIIISCNRRLFLQIQYEIGVVDDRFVAGQDIGADHSVDLFFAHSGESRICMIETYQVYRIIGFCQRPDLQRR